MYLIQVSNSNQRSKLHAVVNSVLRETFILTTLLMPLRKYSDLKQLVRIYCEMLGSGGNFLNIISQQLKNFKVT